MRPRVAPICICLVLGFGAAQLKLSPAELHAQAPSLPQGTTQPGPPMPRTQMPPRDGAVVEAPTGTGRIRGRVVAADTGAPLRRAQVRLSAAEVRINRSANTDAEGRYEFSDLPAGRYNISVSRSGFVSLSFGQQRPFEQGRPLELGNAQQADKIDFALPRGGVIAGRVTDELGEPLAGVRVQAMRYQYLSNGRRQLTPVSGGFFGIVTNDLGEFRLYSLMPGTYVVSATPADTMVMMPAGPAGPASISAPDDGHGITYYPGTINVDEAQSITVALADVANASFALVPQRMTRITGVVRNSQGKPLAAPLTLRTQAGAGMSMRMLAMSGADGRFAATNVPPGEHSIEVSPRPGEEEAASIPITAGGQDITDLVITTSPGVTISGQVTFEGTAPAEKTLRVNATSPEPGAPGPMRIFDNTQGVIDEKGRFQLRGMAGRVVFSVFPSAPMAGPLTWFVKSVTFNGENITDVPLDVAGVTDGSALQIVITDKQTTLSGAVRDTRGQPVIDYTVVIFTAPLREDAMPGRYTRAVRPDQQGRFETPGLTPGNNLAAAVESLEMGGQWDPAFRRQVEPAARRFRLTEGQAATIDLTLAP
jgi:protocatechuate 3,4-dioxygenase beta subunit